MAGAIGSAPRSLSALGARPDHWHVAFGRASTWKFPPERYERSTALRVIRDMVIVDGHRTGDRRFHDALAALDRGYESYRIDTWFYVAYACACPSTHWKKGHDEGTRLPQVVAL